MKISAEALPLARHVITGITVILFGFHVLIIFGFAITLGAGMATWAWILFIAGPVVCIIAVAITLLPPRQRWELLLNIVLLSIYAFYWASIFPNLQWRA